MAATTDGIVGRAQELAAVAGFVDAAADGPAGLLLEGDAGVGKSTLWQHGVEQARVAGSSALVARPAGREAGFAFAALGDLLAGADEAFESLAGPQRQALRVALSLESAGEQPLEERVVALAFLNLLRELARERPVVVAVDDAQWLDPSSGIVLEYAARRLTTEPIRFLATWRTTEGTSLGALLPAPVTRVEIGPLSMGALQRLLADRLGRQLPRRSLRRLWEISGGNPFYALELAKSADTEEAGLEAPGALPRDLADLLRRRISALPADTRDVLLAAALLAEPTLDILDAVTGQLVWPVLGPAVDADIVVVEDERLRFSHPLLGAAVAAESDPRRRKALHARLATVVAGSEQRARHLALSVEPPDEHVAATLVEAGRAAAARGAAYAAADLSEKALEYTPADSRARTERLLEAVENQARIGAFGSYIAELESALARLQPGPERARVYFMLARTRWRGSRDPAFSLALEDAAADPGLRARILCEAMSAELTSFLGDSEKAETGLEEAVRLAQSVGDSELEARCRANLAWARAALGKEVEAALTGIELPAEQLFDHPDRVRAVQKLWRGEFDQAEALLLPLRARAAADEQEWAAFIFVLHLVELELRRGDWPAARRRYEELELAAVGPASEPSLARCRALLAAIRGDRAGAAAAARHVDISHGSRWQQLEASRALGTAALAAGAPADSIPHLREVVETTAAAKYRDPGAFPAAPDLIEALIFIGQHEEAEAELERFESVSQELAHPWGLAVAARCRGLVHGDEATLREAVERAELVGLPFDRARALLALGQLQLRARRRGDARVSLEQALEAFAALDTPPWEERARANLARIGGRAASRDDLTPAERRIAALVADGRTNKEAAAELFLSENTIESTLRRVYRKLGIRSRAELARRFTG